MEDRESGEYCFPAEDWGDFISCGPRGRAEGGPRAEPLETVEGGGGMIGGG